MSKFRIVTANRDETIEAVAVIVDASPQNSRRRIEGDQPLIFVDGTRLIYWTDNGEHRVVTDKFSIIELDGA